MLNRIKWLRALKHDIDGLWGTQSHRAEMKRRFNRLKFWFQRGY